MEAKDEIKKPQVKLLALSLIVSSLLSLKFVYMLALPFYVLSYKKILGIRVEPCHFRTPFKKKSSVLYFNDTRFHVNSFIVSIALFEQSQQVS